MTIGTLASLAMRLNGAAGSRAHDRVTVGTVLRALADGNIFDYLDRDRNLPGSPVGEGAGIEMDGVAAPERVWLQEHWRRMAAGYEPGQFHVDRSGLALLVAYTLHLIYCLDYVPPQ